MRVKEYLQNKIKAAAGWLPEQLRFSVDKDLASSAGVVFYRCSYLLFVSLLLLENGKYSVTAIFFFILFILKTASDTFIILYLSFIK